MTCTGISNPPFNAALVNTHHHLAKELILLSQFLVFFRQEHHAPTQLFDSHLLASSRFLCRLIMSDNT